MKTDKKKCFHPNAYLGATHMRLQTEKGAVKSMHGVLIGHHHFHCKECGDQWANPIWEIPMTVDHSKAMEASAT